MPFSPDIVVTAPGESDINLVVNAATALPDFGATEEGLKIYMVLLQCPIGLLITPDRLWLYHDRYTSRSPDSVELVGEFDVATVWEDPPPSQKPRFEAFVQRWLDDLPQGPVNDLPKDLRNAIREYILPAIAGGEVRAAHPR